MRSFSGQMLAPSDGSYLCLAVGWTRLARLSGSTAQNLGCIFHRMHLITLFPGSSAFSHRYFCLPHLSRRLILQSWQSLCRSLRPQPASFFPPRAQVSLSYSSNVTVLLCLTTSCHHRHLNHQHRGATVLKPSFPFPCLILSRKPTETKTSCVLKIQFYVLYRTGGCESSFSLFLHHLWWQNLSAFPVLSGRIFC